MKIKTRGIVYKYTGPTGKVYIGQTIDPERRKREHAAAKDECYFHRAIKKHGFESFKYEVLAVAPVERLDEIESYFIKYFKSDNSEFGYNQTTGGCVNRSFSEEYRKKLSAAKKGKPGPFAGKKRPDIGKKVADKLSKPVLQFSLEGKLINRFESCRDAGRKTGFSKGNISNCCLGRLKTAYGYLWKYETA